MYIVNANGLKQIAECLRELHKNSDISQSTEAINAYASDVESSLYEGNGASFEIRGFLSYFGNPVVCTLSHFGVDRIEYDEDLKIATFTGTTGMGEYVENQEAHNVDSLEKARTIWGI